MIRRLAALAAAVLLAAPALSQEAKKTEAASEKKAETAPEKKGGDAPELDPKTKAAIAREVEKAKAEIRDEVRAEMQGAQSAAEFLGAVAEGPKLEFVELDGYLRFRGQLANDLQLGAGTDKFGYYYYPSPIFDPNGRTTLATANMRLRVEPTLNVSEHIRVRAQLDVLDNYAYGSSTSRAFDAPFSPYPVPFYGSSRLVSSSDPRLDRDPIQPKRAWGEVQTPVGLLSFGRMPSAWGLGILTHAGGGLDDDYGDTVDRLQFALAPVQTPLGGLTFVPILDFNDEGVLYADPRFGAGSGQPFDADSEDDARSYAVKVARIDTDDELRRTLEAGRSSFNFGAYYNYQNQRNSFPGWNERGFALDPKTLVGVPSGTLLVERRVYNHVLDLWARFATARLRVELEGTGVYGHVGEAGVVVATSVGDPTPIVKSLGDVDLRQWGGALVTDYKAIPNKVSFGLDAGIASGDSAPGFGNVPNRFRYDPGATAADGTFVFPPLGSIEGPQFGQPGDHSIRNFRFNPAYRIDLVLWRNILGQVTDAWYLRPHLRWDILPGLGFDAAIIYSQAMYGQSTPSSNEALVLSDGTPIPKYNGKKALGVEGDLRLTYSTGDGFVAWTEWGIFEPLGGMGKDLSRGNVLNAGLAIKF